MNPTTSSQYTYPAEIKDFYCRNVLQKESIPNHKEPFFEGMGVDVGLLRGMWTLPSDHVPVGLILSGEEQICIVSWNVLNSGYMKFVLGDYQGLVGSVITEEDISLGEDGFTIREQHVIDLILKMLNSPNTSKDVIALQECGQIFLNHLRQSLPQHMQIIYTDENAKDQSVFLYNTRVFECEEVTIKKGIFSDRPERAALNVQLRSKMTGEFLRCITAHLPWIPDGSGAKELAAYLLEQQSLLRNDETLVVMGDMNRTEIEIEQSFKEVGLFGQQISPYCTYIPYLKDGVYTQTADVDHLFVFGQREGQARATLPDEIFPELEALVKTLHGKD